MTAAPRPSRGSLTRRPPNQRYQQSQLWLVNPSAPARITGASEIAVERATRYNETYRWFENVHRRGNTVRMTLRHMPTLLSEWVPNSVAIIDTGSILLVAFDVSREDSVSTTRMLNILSRRMQPLRALPSERAIASLRGRILGALSDSDYDFRSPRGIAEQVGATEDDVLSVLDDLVTRGEARRPRVPVEGGRPLFTLNSHRPDWREHWAIIRAFLMRTAP